jgi:hypothetical protein
MQDIYDVLWMMVLREIGYDMNWFRIRSHINIMYQGVYNFIYRLLSDNVSTEEFCSIERN